MSVLYAHSAHIWLTACEARNRAIASVKANQSAWPNDAIVAIVLSAASTEAFINELGELVAMKKVRLEGSPSRELLAFADVIAEIEESRGSLLLKYLMAAQTLGGSPFIKGMNPFQDFATLVTLRNDIMHLKPKDKSVTGCGRVESVSHPKYIVGLQQRGLARSPPSDVDMSWFNSLQTAEIAIWAVDTARAIILAVLALIPDDPIPGRDLTFFFKTQFRNPVL
jgi:hypothetical protein